MKKFIYLFILFFSLLNTHSIAKENTMILKLKYGEVEIELYPEKAPNHVKRFKKISDEGRYDNVVFHRVIDGFMAQTGDVKFGNISSPDFNLNYFLILLIQEELCLQQDHQIRIALIVNFLYVLILLLI